MELLQIVAALALVFGLLGLFYWLASKAGAQAIARGHRKIQVLEKQPLGDKTSLLLVKVNGETYLLGSTGQSISMLAVVQGTAEPAETDEADQHRVTPGFRRLLGLLR